MRLVLVSAGLLLAGWVASAAADLVPPVPPVPPVQIPTLPVLPPPPRLPPPPHPPPSAPQLPPASVSRLPAPPAVSLPRLLFGGTVGVAVTGAWSLIGAAVSSVQRTRSS